MRSAFGPHEDDFEVWRLDGFPGVTEATGDYLRHLTEPGHPRPLWRHQEGGFLRTVYAYEILDWKNLLLNIVTGGGKTAIIAATIAWLRLCHEVRSFLLLAPNTIVRERLAEDFRTGKIFTDFQLLPGHRAHLIDELGLTILGQGRGPQAMLESGVILGNIQQLYPRDGQLNRNLAFLLSHLGQLAVFNDEAHNTPAPEYTRALLLLRANQTFRLDTTATPDRADAQSPDSDMVFEYGIPQALADGIIKTTVVYQPDISRVDLAYIDEVTGERIRVEEVDWEDIDKVGSIRATQWVTDPMPLRYQLKIALARLEEQRQRAQGRYKPILFVVTVGVTDARNVQRVLEQEFDVRALVVTEESDEQERAEAMRIGKPESAYDAVVSVLMLREGWDVPEVSVILLLRKFSSRVYGQQVIGRGLRKIIRRPEEREILCVVDHPKLEHDWLWDLVRARVRTGVDDQQQFDVDDDLPEPTYPEVVRPDLIIEVPEVDGAGDEVDVDAILEGIEAVGPREDWKQLLARLEYERGEVEITDLKLRGVISVTLDTRGFEAELAAPGKVEEITVEFEPPSREELEGAIKREALAIVADALAEDGVGSVHKERVYNILMDHLQEKLLNGKSLGLADETDLRFAVATLDDVRRVVLTPGLVSGIVRYP